MARRLLLLFAMLALALPGTASARTWSAEVVEVHDGDTIEVDIADRSRRTFDVRLIAVQAMEQSRYSRVASRRRGQCHSLEATAYLERLIKRARGRVRLSTSLAVTDFKGRLKRSVAVRLGGRWQDVGLSLIRAGHALWLPSDDDTGRNRAYNAAQQQAALRGRNLWDPDHCGNGPAQEVPVRIWAHSDPIGIDQRKVDGEWLKVRNLSTSQPLDLGGWWVRDSHIRRFTFPAGTTLAPGATATVHTGPGTRTGTTFYWGQAKPTFENADAPGKDLGDGAYLFDPKGDLRAWMLYPCVVACSDPAQGALGLEVRPQRPETVTVHNVSAGPIELYGYRLSLPLSSWPFPEGAVVPAGGTYRVDVAEWDNGSYWLVDAGGSVRLQTFSDVTVACDAWGSGSC